MRRGRNLRRRLAADAGGDLASDRSGHCILRLLNLLSLTLTLRRVMQLLLNVLVAFGSERGHGGGRLGIDEILAILRYQLSVQ